VKKTLAIAAIVAALSLATSLMAADPASVQKIAEDVDRHYNALVTLQTDFVETYRGQGMNRSESGTLWLKKPGRMRWEYRQPREKLFVSDGKTAWFYVPGDQQVRKAEAKNLDDIRSPLRYLLGRTKLMKEFSGLSLTPDQKPGSPGNLVLRGVPKGMEDRVSQVLLEITPERMLERIVIYEADGAVTEFRFSNQKENLAVAESRFRFQAPSGVETVEMRDLGQ
jgi:outer membrane lipoprotein carrier protein